MIPLFQMSSIALYTVHLLSTTAWATSPALTLTYLHTSLKLDHMDLQLAGHMVSRHFTGPPLQFLGGFQRLVYDAVEKLQLSGSYIEFKPYIIILLK